MSRCWLRLFAWVGLVAFVVADPHAVAAVAPLVSPTAPCRCAAGGWAAQAGPSSDRPDDDQSCRYCRRCAKKAEGGGKTPGAKAGRPSGCPSCPGCPKGPACPLPGGCHYCNAAKVPCLLALVAWPDVSAPVTDASPEVAPFYASPSQGRLRRPPKS